ncbi:MAG: T9SS type A sorting domain-containing protein [Bacteroidia bacterium]|nr:T9SS type A sorting domain-containing protein [Bacteroidia bacterium]
MNIPIRLILLFAATTAVAQPTATDLSYLPLHNGNIWLYKVYDWTPQGERFSGWNEVRIVKDSLFPNGKRYFVFSNNTTLRVDSTTGVVYGYRGPHNASAYCPDTTEYEELNLSIRNDSLYFRCGDTFPMAPWRIDSLPSDVIGELYVNFKRPRRVWGGGAFHFHYRYAEGLGRYYMNNLGRISYLYHARINGVDYWPVTFRSFTATPLPDNQVHLRWRTEAEVQNAGFTVQRQIAGESESWDDLHFIRARAAEHAGADYEYTDVTAASLPAGERLKYRLRQLDFDGSTAYSDIAGVELASVPNSAALSVWPNPAADHVSIHVTNTDAPPALLLVTDLLGRELKRFDGIESGTVLNWDLTSQTGRRVAAGVYLLRLMGNGRTTDRMLLLR